MEAAYQRQLTLQSVEVYEADYVRFTKLCRRYGMTMAQMFHSLLSEVHAIHVAHAESWTVPFPDLGRERNGRECEFVD